MLKDARWIACPQEIVSPVISRTFTIHSPIAAMLSVTGLGYFTVFINGERVSDDLFVPALSDYEPRDMRAFGYPIYDQTSHRIYYLCYDVARFLQDGENLLEIQLGPGWYIQNERDAEGNMSFGTQLKAIYELKIDQDEETMILSSDGSESCYPSQILYSNLFIGEVIDGRIDGPSMGSFPVTLVDAPDAELCEQQFPSDGVIRTIEPVCLKAEGRRAIFDCQENISGRVCVKAGGNSGNRIMVRYSEEVFPLTGELDMLSAGGDYVMTSGKKQIQSDTFICSEESKIYAAEYAWHGFRYFEIIGDYDELTVEVIHTRVPVISSFESSNETLNWLYDAYIRTQLDNLHGCIPSDCPHRERLGYTGDGQITCNSAMLTLDMRRVYRKWIQDILDCQDPISGHVQHTAPMLGGGGGPGGWGCAVIIVPHEYYKHFGDEEILRKCYPAMKAWISYLKNHSKLGIVTHEEEKGWCLGDWATIGEVKIPAEFVNTCYMLDALRRIIEIAQILKKHADLKLYQSYEELVRDAMYQYYYDPATGSFCDGEQGADAFAIWAGLDVDSRTKTNLVDRYSSSPVFDTGFLGTPILIQTLTQIGEYDLAYKLLTSTNRVGTFESIRLTGATTLWEYMNGEGSHNHPMFGGVVRHLFESMLGITQQKGSVGYQELLIEPHLPSELDVAAGSVVLPCGEVSVLLARSGRGIKCTIHIPETNQPVPLIWQNTSYMLKSGENRLVLPAV